MCLRDLSRGFQQVICTRFPLDRSPIKNDNVVRFKNLLLFKQIAAVCVRRIIALTPWSCGQSATCYTVVGKIWRGQTKGGGRSIATVLRTTNFENTKHIMFAVKMMKWRTQ